MQTINDQNDPQVHLIMDLASMKHDVFRAEQLLADCVMREHEVMASLLKTKVTTLQHKFRQDDIGHELSTTEAACQWILYLSYYPSHAVSTLWDSVSIWSLNSALHQHQPGTSGML
ncbi:hypothetical protein BDR07DRAFT_1375344 [Suillus spraguei]|nr:hypothetical protein BDR07DRAFT_1375344 [Suillus spraguei]